MIVFGHCGSFIIFLFFLFLNFIFFCVGKWLFQGFMLCIGDVIEHGVVLFSPL